MTPQPQVPDIDIQPAQWEIIRTILQTHIPQYEIWAFGSRATRTAKPYSDLDLAIITETPLPLQVSANLTHDLTESDLPWKVDIIDWATTSQQFRQIIKAHHVVIQTAPS